MTTKKELIATLEAKGKEIVDLGIGYDSEHHNQQIAEGKYANAVTISHFWSGIESDHTYF
jgi:hypothetical protein